MPAPRLPVGPGASPEALHVAFVALLPRIALHGEIYFRHIRCPFTRDDLVAEMIGLSWKWYVRLIERGKDPAQFPTALATFAARAVRSGRRVSSPSHGLSPWGCRR